MLSKLEIRTEAASGIKILKVGFNEAGIWCMDVSDTDMAAALKYMDASGLDYEYRTGEDGEWVTRDGRTLTIWCPGMIGNRLLGVDFSLTGLWTRKCKHHERIHALERLGIGGYPYSYLVDGSEWVGSPPPVSSKPLAVVEKEDHETGATRGTNIGRGRMDLISHRFLRRLSIHLEKGAEHYAPRNWEKGLPLHRTFCSMIRHSYQWISGDRTEDHLAAVACNIMFLIHTEEMIVEGLLPSNLLDELPDSYVK